MGLQCRQKRLQGQLKSRLSWMIQKGLQCRWEKFQWRQGGTSVEAAGEASMKAVVE